MSSNAALQGKNIYGCFPKLGYLFGGPYNEDHNISGFTLGSPYLGNLPYFGRPMNGLRADLDGEITALIASTSSSSQNGKGLAVMDRPA